jgi:hypothetical protein
MTTKRIEVAFDGGSRDVDAFVFGEWAAHESVAGDQYVTDEDDNYVRSEITFWTVTHVPTGMAARKRITMGQALLVAETIDAALGGRLRFTLRLARKPASNFVLGAIESALHAGV